MSISHHISGGFLLCLLSAGLAAPCLALDPEPRKWSHLPMDTSFAGVAYAYTEADISFDPTLTLEDVEMELDTWGGKYIRTFGLFGKSARIDVRQAYQKARWKGLLGGAPAATRRSGLSDTFVRFAVNFYGAPPLRGKEYAAYRAGTKTETIAGAGLAVRLPTGNYQEDKLLNLGQNRYVFRPQLGVMHRRGKWTTELTGEVAFYTENDEFFNGNRLEQKTLYIVHGHLIRSFRPGHWASISAGYDYGGENTLNGVNKDDRKQDIAWKLSYAYPLSRTSGLKVSYIGTRTQQDTGFDSETLALALSLAW